MRHISRFISWLFVIHITFFSTNALAQVFVSAMGGLPSTQYSTLKGAFDAINIGLHTGQVFITLTGSTTETATATLNASGGLANYTRVNIMPSVACTITGNIAGALIHLNSADSVTIDGVERKYADGCFSHWNISMGDLSRLHSIYRSNW